MKRVIVIGGGASGMAAAYQAANAGGDVLLLEQNEKLGKKLFITGKGRCNLTNDSDPGTLLQNVVRNPKFLFSAFYGFTPEDVQNLMRENGCSVKTERGNRVFPVSDHSSDVIKAWERALGKAGVTVKLNTKVTGIKASENFVEGIFASEDGRAARFYGADAFVVATGGITYPATGSTGDGYRFLRSLGVGITDCYPSLVPLETSETWPAKLSGLTLKNVSVVFSQHGKSVYEDFGELLFTHFGISGPTVLSASAFLTEKLAKGERVGLSIDLKPALAFETVDRKIVSMIEEAPKSSLRNALRPLLPSSLLAVMLDLAHVSSDHQASLLTKEERAAIVSKVKALPLTITRTRSAAEAVVTDGGVDVSEIDPKTMRIKKYRNLYAAGELIDVDAKTGGFNLQIAWSTGILAGKNAGGN